MLIATLMWGMMAPIGKDAMLHGISGLSMVGIRACGGALLFWLASIVPLSGTIVFISVQAESTRPANKTGIYL